MYNSRTTSKSRTTSIYKMPNYKRQRDTCAAFKENKRPKNIINNNNKRKERKERNEYKK